MILIAKTIARHLYLFISQHWRSNDTYISIYSLNIIIIQQTIFNIYTVFNYFFTQKKKKHLKVERYTLSVRIKTFNE